MDLCREIDTPLKKDPNGNIDKIWFLLSIDFNSFFFPFYLNNSKVIHYLIYNILLRPTVDGILPFIFPDIILRMMQSFSLPHTSIWPVSSFTPLMTLFLGII